MNFFITYIRISVLSITGIRSWFYEACPVRGHPFMTSTKNPIFHSLPLSTCVLMNRTPLPLWTSTCGRHEIHIALLKRLVQWTSGLKAEIRLYDSNLFKTVLLVFILLIYIVEKFPLFILSKDKTLVKKTSTSLYEKKTGWHQWNLFLIFCVHMRPPEPDPPPPPCGHHKWMAPNSGTGLVSFSNLKEASISTTFFMKTIYLTVTFSQLLTWIWSASPVQGPYRLRSAGSNPQLLDFGPMCYWIDASDPENTCVILWLLWSRIICDGVISIFNCCFFLGSRENCFGVQSWGAI